MDFQSISDLIKQAPDSGAAFAFTIIGFIIIFFIVTKILRIFAFLAFIWVMGVVVASLQGYDVSSVTNPIVNYTNKVIQPVKDKAKSLTGGNSSTGNTNNPNKPSEKEIEKNIYDSIKKMINR